MELWLEYLLRRKLDVPKRQDNIVVKRSYMTDWQIWIYFLSTYRPIIQACESPVSLICAGWIRDWSRNQNCNISLAEQKTILFRIMPHLETVWGKWQQCMFDSRSLLSDITI